MDPETIEYIKTGLEYLAVSEGIRISTLIGVGYFQAFFLRKINNQGELDAIVQEEAEKLEISSPIKAVLHSSNAGKSIKKDDDSYEVHVGGFLARRCIVKHELYHIFKNHHDSRFQNLPFLLRSINYSYIQEPQAVAYQVFGWKL